jgi:hypothetical protein
VGNRTGDLAGLANWNALDHRPVVRTLFGAMDRWVSEDIAPPASRYPRISDGTLVAAEDAAWPRIPGFVFPPPRIGIYRLDFGPNWPGGIVDREPPGIGKPFVLSVPAVDADGNDLAGVRTPEIAVPLATHFGWNYRHPSIGASQHLAGEIGSYLPFARRRGDREATADSRQSIEERYQSKTDYLGRITEAALQLVRDGYLLSQDLPDVLARASAHWDFATPSPETTRPGN